jgi:hypothetical protein
VTLTKEALLFAIPSQKVGGFFVVLQQELKSTMMTVLSWCLMKQLRAFKFFLAKVVAIEGGGCTSH